MTLIFITSCDINILVYFTGDEIRNYDCIQTITKTKLPRRSALGKNSVHIKMLLCAKIFSCNMYNLLEEIEYLRTCKQKCYC